MNKVKLGNEVLLSTMSRLVEGRKIGLITNYTGVTSQFVSTIEVLHQHPKINLCALLGPEHGVRGEAQAGEKVYSYTDEETGLPVFSLYGETKKPTDEMLEGLDTLVFDIQDVGVRYYTYISTMAYCMEKAAERDLKFIILDRPNPVRGDVVDGPVLDPDFASFIGLYPIQLRYGLTIGELAQLINGEFGIGADLTVVPMEGWRRFLWYNETGLPWLPPSLGIPTLETAVLYTGTCFIEGTNLSEGRGTALPFHLIGAPFVKGQRLAEELNALGLPGVYFRPAYFKPTASKHQGVLCQGVQIHLLDRNVFKGAKTGLGILSVLKRLYPDDFQWFTFTKEGKTRHFIDLLWGTDQVRRYLEDGQSLLSLEDDWKQEITAFQAVRQKYLLYE